MVVECVTTAAIILLIAFTFLRAGRTNYAVAALPLALVPAVHVLAGFCAKYFAQLLGARTGIVILCADLLALVVSCILYGVFVNAISSKRSRKTYLICCGAFSLIFTFLLIRGVVDTHFAH